MDKKSDKLIFNYLPPALPHFPSPAFSVLKSFLGQYGYESKILNWNILIHDLMISYLPPFIGQPGEYDALYLVPFLWEIAEDCDDLVAKQRILSYFQSIFPNYTIDIGAVSSKRIEHLKNGVFRLIDSELENLDIDSVILFGFSAKFYQWIPGVALAKKLKKSFPGIKIVIGGFGNRNEAIAVMRKCPYFDYAIWGEGEYPVLELLKRLRKEEKANQFETVPRLVYRDYTNQRELKITTSRSRYVDFQDYIYPDFTEIIKKHQENHGDRTLILPLEVSRGCHWNRCKFCFLNEGYRYRGRSPESIVREVELMFSRYKINEFMIVSSDIVGSDIYQFEVLLDMLLESSYKNRVIYKFQSEIMPHGFNSRIIEKMAIAGFTNVQIGYEAITDKLLKKMDKKTDFSDLILFVKFASKFGISIVGANIIRGIVGETAEDVLKSTENLKFLRFFLNSRPGKWRYCHTLTQLRLEPGSRFSRRVDAEERNKWNFHPTAYLLSEDFCDRNTQSHLFSFTGNLENKIEWEHFEKINKFYEETEFKYQILKNKDVRYYSEFMDRSLINHIVFNEPKHWELLKAANDAVTSLKIIFDELKEKFTALTKEHLIEIVKELKSNYLLYANEDLTRIISIIDTQNVHGA